MLSHQQQLDGFSFSIHHEILVDHLATVKIKFILYKSFGIGFKQTSLSNFITHVDTRHDGEYNNGPNSSDHSSLRILRGKFLSLKAQSFYNEYGCKTNEQTVDKKK